MTNLTKQVKSIYDRLCFESYLWECVEQVRHHGQVENARVDINCPHGNVSI